MLPSFDFTNPQSYHRMSAFEDPRLQDPSMSFPLNTWTPAGAVDNPTLTGPQDSDASWALIDPYEENPFGHSPEQESEGRPSKRRQL